MTDPFKKPLLNLIGTVKNREDGSPYIEKGQIFVQDPKLTQSVIVISDSFVKTEKINVVLYLHGYRAPAIDQYFKNRKFKDIIDASKKSFVFIAPQLGSKSEFVSTAGEAKAYMKRMLEMLATYGPFAKAPEVKQLVLAAHSGGGAPMLNLTSWFKDDYSIVEAWLMDCLYGVGDPVGAPRKEHLFEPDSVQQRDAQGKPVLNADLKPVYVSVSSANSVVDWRKRIKGSVEEQWFNLSKGGLSIKVFWGNGGTLTRTANLDLMDHFDQFSFNVDMRPEFYRCPTTENPVVIDPGPIPRSQHDPLPETVLAECIKDCSYL